MKERQYWIVTWREPHQWDRLCAIHEATAEEVDNWIKAHRPNATDVCKYIALTEREYNQLKEKKMELPNNHIYSISEENHGTLAVASSVKAAIAYLINHKWLTECNCVCIENKGWVSVRMHFGWDWRQKIMAMSLDQFNEVFSDLFYIDENIPYTNETVE